MTGYHLAELNIGTARAPTGSPEMAGFMAGIIPVNALADSASGFVWRLQDGDGPGATALRPCGPDVMVNMSVWEDLESLRSLYDYILVARGGAYGVHNPKYVAELLYDSYFALSGLPLATFPQRP